MALGPAHEKELGAVLQPAQVPPLLFGDGRAKAGCGARGKLGVLCVRQSWELGSGQTTEGSSEGSLRSWAGFVWPKGSLLAAYSSREIITKMVELHCP